MVPWPPDDLIAENLVLYALRTVDVTVVNLFGGGFSNFTHGDVEVKGLASQFVIGIQGDLVALDGDDGHNFDAGAGLGLKSHAWLDHIYTLEQAARQGLDQLSSRSP